MTVDVESDCGHNGRMTIGPGPDVALTHLPLRRAKASFSELVSRADLMGEVTVLTKHGRPAAAIVPADRAAGAAAARALLDEVWALLDRRCPPGTDEVVDGARVRHRRLPTAATVSAIGEPVIARVGT
ncbi:type II toxin-antitoxin system Phd/YefM family antitoxin [Virgisporangium ochraceum]|uniref:type II toxin-antitoxin system Phd/YefM family antitoxin n=1 Tax=Virgisporangium ochraceum TaxID=65505 RepID=UPI001EF2EB21|nr:type II toxin-antitoxin system prevent-host-death family antitoxin [Virgisporangium ochraceum]